MPSLEQDHFFLLELASIFEPLFSQHFDQSYQSIEALLYEVPWDKHIDGPIPSEAIDCTPQHWYTQYWYNCTFALQCANCWNCFLSLWFGALTEATPQQRRRQQRCGEQRHGNGNGKGILVTTAWRSSIAASFALFLLHSYILLHSIE